MKMVKKKKLQNLIKKHNQYIKSLGVNIDLDTGEIQSQFEGYFQIIYGVHLITSDNIWVIHKTLLR